MSDVSNWTKFVQNVAIALLVLFVFVTTSQSQMVIPDEFTNLKVLPKDISKAELMDKMKGFTRALDIRCNNCHVVKPDRTWDFASDTMEFKDKARIMIQMVESINSSHLSKLASDGKNHSAKVQCATCHRGHKEPETIDEALNTAYTSGGINEAVKKYRELREKFYGGAGYDFTESSIVNFVGSSIPDTLAMDGVELLKLNIEYIEKPSLSHFFIGQIYSRMDNKEAAIMHMEKSIEIDPEFQFAKQMLERLKK